MLGWYPFAKKNYRMFHYANIFVMQHAYTYIFIHTRLYYSFFLNTIFFLKTKGLSHSRKCLKGNKCHYLHLFNNPGNKYNTPMVINRTPSIKASMATPLLRYFVKILTQSIVKVFGTFCSWNAVTASDVMHSSRNWRWSESPEMEVSAATDELEINKTETSNTKRSSSSEVKHIDHMNVEQTSGNSHNDNNKRHKRKKHKHKHERDKVHKAHKKHKQKREHSSDSVDSDAVRRGKSQTKQKSKYSRSSSSCSTYTGDSSKHRRSPVKGLKNKLNKYESRSHSRTRDKRYTFFLF